MHLAEAIKCCRYSSCPCNDIQGCRLAALLDLWGKHIIAHSRSYTVNTVKLPSRYSAAAAIWQYTCGCPPDTRPVKLAVVCVIPDALRQALRLVGRLPGRLGGGQELVDQRLGLWRGLDAGRLRAFFDHSGVCPNRWHHRRALAVGAAYADFQVPAGALQHLRRYRAAVLGEVPVHLLPAAPEHGDLCQIIPILREAEIHAQTHTAAGDRLRGLRCGVSFSRDHIDHAHSPFWPYATISPPFHVTPLSAKSGRLSPPAPHLCQGVLFKSFSPLGYCVKYSRSFCAGVRFRLSM